MEGQAYLKSKHSLIGLSIFFYSFVLIPALPLIAWELFSSPLWRGRGLAIEALGLVLLPGVLIGWWASEDHQAQWKKIGMTVAGVTLVLAVFLLITTPTGRSREGSPVSQRFTNGGRFRRFAITNIIPEVDQVNLGFTLLAPVDPYLTWSQSREWQAVTMDIYREMEADPDFRRLGSVMGRSYNELILLPYDVGHYYLYVPENRPAGPLPAVVFLHGSGGNFKAYTWVWSKLAEEMGFVLIAPGYGFGNWDGEAGVNAVMRALDDASTVVEIDPDRVVLAGLSNGGLGVSYSGDAYPDRFKGLIFLSPVIQESVTNGEHFQNAWQGRPVLIITGEADKRIPVTWIDQQAANLTSAGVEVTYFVYPDFDHFLIFSQQGGVRANIRGWLEPLIGD